MPKRIATSLALRLGGLLFSRAAAKRIAVNTAGYYAVVETVDLAADYSDWVREHQNFIVNVASVATLGSSLVPGVARKALSRTIVRNPRAWIAGASALAVYPIIDSLQFDFQRGFETIDGAVEPAFTIKMSGAGNGVSSPEVKVVLSTKEGKILFRSNIPGVAETLSLLPVGGLEGLLSNEDSGFFSDFIQSVAAEAAAIISSSDLSRLRNDLMNMSASRLLGSQRSLLEGLSLRFRNLTEDQIASEIIGSLQRVENNIGPITFETGKTTDGLEYLLIGSKLFVVNDDSELVFTNASDHNLGYSPEAPIANAYAHLMIRFIQIIREEEYVPFYAEDGDNGEVEMTAPITDRNFSVQLVRVKYEGTSSKYAYHFIGEKIGSIEEFARLTAELTDGFIDFSSESLQDAISSVENKQTVAVVEEESFFDGVFGGIFGDESADDNSSKEQVFVTQGEIGGTKVLLEPGYKLVKLLDL